MSVRARRPHDGKWGNLSADSLISNIVAADALYTLYFLHAPRCDGEQEPVAWARGGGAGGVAGRQRRHRRIQVTGGLRAGRGD
ncbi:hypothetical protein ACIPM2_32025 [Streptomyces sp. NPDC086081]|uniref:hypothetical protein n=1 Tax=Streptomyces sp. NPDC086081 TaxID=3365749 RepID=UPI0038184C00